MPAVKVAQKPQTQVSIEEDIPEPELLPTRDTLRTGLPTSEDVSIKLKRIAAAITFKDKSEGEIFGAQNFKFKAGSRVVYSERLHQEFQNEFARDVEEIFTRIQRIKLRAIAYDLKGAHYREEPKGASYSWDEHFPVAKFSSLASGYAWKDGPLTEVEKRKLVDGFNALIGGRYAISVTPFINSSDAEICRSVASSMRFYKEGLKEEDRARLHPIIERIQKLESEIHEMKNSPLLFGSDGNSENHFETVLKECWQEYRAIVKEFATFEELKSWFSPSYAHGVTPQCGERQKAEPFRSDYQRWAMEEVRALEPEMHSTFFRKTDYGERAESLLFGGGLSALQAIFNLIEADFERGQNYRIKAYEGKKERPPPSVFKTKRIYFEVDQQIETFCDAHGIKPVEFEPNDTDGLIKRIKKELPNVVFLNPMSNMYEMEVTQISKILRALCDQDWQRAVADRIYTKGGMTGRHLYFIIDNSTLGSLMRWKHFDFRSLPRFVRIVNFESLVKYGQDGLDLVPAGLVTAIGEYAGSELESIRRRSGFMPPENTARKLGYLIDDEALARKMARHSRNTLVLAKSIDDFANEEGFVRRAIHPLLETHPQNDIARTEMDDAAGLFNVALSFDFLHKYRERHGSDGDPWYSQPIEKYKWHEKSKLISKAFTELATLLARSVNLELNQGTSYGFNITRLAVYDHLIDSKVEPDYELRMFPYIRVSPGTENLKDTKLLSAIFRRANEIFTTAIRERRILTLSEKLVQRKLEVEHK